MNAPAEDLMVDVLYGIFMHRLPLAGMTVHEVRRRITELMNIDTAARSLIDGRLVEDEAATALTAGQTLVFVKLAGEMG
jgi:hypothetical protein